MLPVGGEAPRCCGESKKRVYMGASILFKWGYPGWVDKMDDIHKGQADRGERLRMVYPWEVGAT